MKFFQILNIGVVLFALFLINYSPLSAQVSSISEFENESDYPLIGNWTGRWIDPQIGYEKQNPKVSAQVNLIKGNTYSVCILPKLNIRSVPFIIVEVEEKEGAIHYKKDGWEFTFKDGNCHGAGDLHGHQIVFNLKKDQFISPTLGIRPPDGSVVLFDGTNFDQWIHQDNRSVTWKLVTPDAMETVSAFWRNEQNRKEGIGGTIETKQKFGDLKFHMEFRYSIEPGKSGQQRGNSGLFFYGVGEIQILNSFALIGYWNDIGAIYKRFPPTVNAAGPPLVWQTYDVDLIMPKFDQNSGKKLSKGMLTVWLNGVLIHNKLEMDFDTTEVSIGLQDHINALQFRNIWVKTDK
jgi:hypothetical protein